MIEREFFIAGVKFHDLKDVISQLNEGDEFELVPEPDNKFDSNAVALKINETMCGYIPKTFSAEIAAAIETSDDGSIVCQIISLNPQAQPWEQCKVRVFEREADYQEED